MPADFESRITTDEGRASRPRVREWGLDALVLATLLLLAAVPFRGAIGHPETVISGMDLNQHYSREVVNRRAFKTTWIPLWNPYEFSGFPAQADPQIGVFYPPSVGLRLFSVPTFLTWTVIVHVWLAGVGGFVLCRTFGVRRSASLVGAIALMLGGATIPRVYAGHLDVLRSFGWTPLALAAAIRSIDRESIRPSAFAVVTLWLQVLAFYPQFICYLGGTIALYSAFAVVWPRTGRRSWQRAGRVTIHFALLWLLVIGLTTFQLFPTARLIMAAGRTQGIDYETAVESALPAADIPRAVLAPARAGGIPNEAWENAAYVGWLPLALVPFACAAPRLRRNVVFCLVVAGLALALATGGPLYSLHYLLLPMFRIPGRLLPFWAIGIASVGAIGLDALADWWARRRWPGVSSWLAGAIPLVAAMLVAWDMAGYAAHWVRLTPVEERFPSSLVLAPTNYGRGLSMCEDRAQTTDLTVNGVPSADGYNSYFLWDYAHLAERAVGEPRSTTLGGFPRMGLKTLPNLDAVNAMDVTDILSCDPIPLAGLQLLAEHERFYLYRNSQAFGRASIRCEDDPRPLTDLSGACPSDGQIEVDEADTPAGVLRLRVALPAPRTVVLAEPYYPERRAWVDGVETTIEKANMALSAIRVSAGYHKIEVRYVPVSLRWGAVTSAVTLALWTGTAFWPTRRRRPGTSQA